MLKENLNKRIEGTQFESNRALLARAAGLNRDEIVRILNGKIKNPGIFTISKIAKALNCSVDDLLGMSSSQDVLHCDKAAFNEKLFVESTQYIANYLAANKLKNIKTGKIMLALDFIYNFSYNKGSSIPNEEIAKYICETSLV